MFTRTTTAPITTQQGYELGGNQHVKLWVEVKADVKIYVGTEVLQDEVNS